MANKDVRIDAYIAHAADFAKPVLEHLRALVHKACPDVEETMKWSFPHFDYKGAMMCSMASFKQHCAFGFWKAALMKDAQKFSRPEGGEAMGSMGKITGLKDLPTDKQLLAYIKEAMVLNEKNVKLVKTKLTASVQTELVVPDYFTSALKKNKKALAAFEKFSYSHKKEYLQWIMEAKTEPTRNKRIEQTLEWLAEGKSRNWKYST